MLDSTRSSQPYLLPAAGRAREYERKALRIRRFAGIAEGEPLDAFALADKIGLRLIDPHILEALPQTVRQQLFQHDAEGWSGSVTPVLPDGSRMVILNPQQSPQRRVATLMEEVCHVLLGHKADRLDFSHQDSRRYDEVKESEAYGVGAAALLPFHVLGSWLQLVIEQKHECENGQKRYLYDLGRRYGVSRSLVVYRLRIVGLWSRWSAIGLG